MHDTASAVRTYNISDELILNAEQKLSKHVSTTNLTMAEQGTAHIPVRGGYGKCALTVTVTQNLSCKMLPFQIIFTGKTERYLSKNSTGKGHLLFLKGIGVTKERGCL